MPDNHAIDGLQKLLDKEAIREVIMRYCRGVDRRDAALINSAYHPGAVDDHGARTFTGDIGQAIVDWLAEFLDVTSHNITTQSITVQGDTAGCESYYIGSHVQTVGNERRVMQTFGRYVDRLERRNGDWRITERVVVVDQGGYIQREDLAFDSGARACQNHGDPSYRALAE